METDTIPEKCPACKERLADSVRLSGGGTGLTTAVVSGPNMKPLGGVIQDVY